MPGEISSEREGAVARVFPTAEKNLGKREEEVLGWASENRHVAGRAREEGGRSTSFEAGGSS